MKISNALKRIFKTTKSLPIVPRSKHDWHEQDRINQERKWAEFKKACGVGE